MSSDKHYSLPKSLNSQTTQQEQHVSSSSVTFFANKIAAYIKQAAGETLNAAFNYFDHG